MLKPATKKGVNGNGHAEALELTNFDLPRGDNFEHVAARGLIRWRESQALTSPEAAEKYGIPHSNWHKVEKAKNPGTTARQIPKILKKIGLSRKQLEELGEPE